MIPLVSGFPSFFCCTSLRFEPKIDSARKRPYPREKAQVLFCSGHAAMRNIATSIVGVCLALLFMSACGHAEQERKIEFIYLALGTSDVIGVGATPLTEGYVYLINQDLQQRILGAFLVTLGLPGARIDVLNEQVRL